MTSSSTTSQNFPEPSPLLKRQSFFILLGLLLGVTLEAIDSNIVNTAMPAIIRSLNGEERMFGWVVAAYLLTFTVTTPLYGRLSDMYGRMPFYLAGMTIFMLGSILSGLSQTMNQLIIFRAVQGFGAGAMMPIAIALGQTIFPKEQRGKVQGVISLAFAVSSILGPVLGGFVTEKLGWHWLFYLNLPFGIVAILLLYSNLPAHVRKGLIGTKQKIDYLGALALTGFSASFILAFELATDQTIGWHSWKPWLALGISMIGLLFFIIIEIRSKSPLIPFSIFRNKTVSISIAAAFLAGVVMMTVVIYLPLFMQRVLDVNPTRAGAVVIPMSLSIVAGSLLVGRNLGRKIQRYKILAVLASCFMCLGIFLLCQTKPDTRIYQAVLSTLPFGFGLGMTFPLYGLIVGHHVPHQFLGLSFGLLAFFRSLGAALSAALFSSLLGSEISKNLYPTLNQVGNVQLLAGVPLDQLLKQPSQNDCIAFLLGPQKDFYLSEHHANQLCDAAKLVLANAIHMVWISGLILALFFLLINLLLPNKKLILTK